MNDKVYKQLLQLIDANILNINDYFFVYTLLFKRKAKETKAGSYGGYEVINFVGEFNNELNNKCADLLKETEKLFINSGRKLSKKQYTELIGKCTKPFDSIIENYSKAVKEEFELNGTLEVSLTLSKERISSRIRGHINALKSISNTKIDKALLWTAVGTIFGGISLILSVIAIIISFQ